MIKIKIRLFGTFRNFGDGEFLYLDAPSDSNINQIKLLLTKQLDILNPAQNNTGLVADSVFATEDSVLDSNDVLKNSCTLALLPPVCGG